MKYDKIIDLTSLVPEPKIEDTMIINHNPTIEDIQNAKDNNKILICNNPTDETLNLIKSLDESLRIFVVLFNVNMIDSEFESYVAEWLKKNEPLPWIKLVINDLWSQTCEN